MTENRLMYQLQNILTSPNRWLATGLVVLVCLLGGLLVGALFAYLTPVIAVTQWGLLALIAVICLLPFGSLPVKIGFTPTFLDVMLGVVFFVWIARIATRQQEEFVASPLALPVLLFMLLAIISFTLGLAHAHPTPNALRRFGETMLGIALFFLVINCVRSQREVEQLVLGIMGLGTLEAIIGIVFYVLPRDWTVRILSKLAVFGYPAGSGVLRFIYDDPERPMRAPHLFARLDGGPGRGTGPAGTGEVPPPARRAGHPGHAVLVPAPDPTLCQPLHAGAGGRGPVHADALW